MCRLEKNLNDDGYSIDMPDILAKVCQHLGRDHCSPDERSEPWESIHGCGIPPSFV
jgi:hypothetical protein